MPKNLTLLNDWNFQLIKLLSSLYLSICAVSIKLESGKGSDKQKVLGIRDGKGFSISRSGKDDIMTSTSSLSLCRAIQPGVPIAQMGNCVNTDVYSLPKNFDRWSRQSFGYQVGIADWKTCLFWKLITCPSLKCGPSHVNLPKIHSLHCYSFT